MLTSFDNKLMKIKNKSGSKWEPRGTPDEGEPDRKLQYPIY